MNPKVVLILRPGMARDDCAALVRAAIPNEAPPVIETLAEGLYGVIEALRAPDDTPGALLHGAQRQIDVVRDPMGNHLAWRQLESSDREAWEQLGRLREFAREAAGRDGVEMANILDSRLDDWEEAARLVTTRWLKMMPAVRGEFRADCDRLVEMLAGITLVAVSEAQYQRARTRLIAHIILVKEIFNQLSYSDHAHIAPIRA